ncbi:MAG: hypothetical protein ACD_2C00221G0011 [uncultured bacterium (gcode 4)]|uniref:Uncharacterized protein n=1 Tax=uncultured bacterium (gcode 4) TaxID=1234023 RepID=K2GFP8_9BACT|nr:MAG: hypothetical protein ACD_2C00221G0011 [uncultured bacterium (gcode 4)]
MYIFFLLINLIFSIIFYLFSHLIESIFFLATWIIMFFYFSPLYFWKKSSKPSLLSKMKISKDTLKKTIPLFQRTAYLIAFLIFYISLYWISYSFWWDLFPYFILILSLLLILLFFILIKKKKPVIHMIYRSNFLVFSFLYIILFTKKLVYSETIDDIFIINSSLSLFWLATTIIFDNLMDKIKKNWYYSYFLTYLNIFLLFYIRYYFKIPYELLFSYLFFILWVFYFEFISKIRIFKKFDLNSKYYWLFLNYIVCIIAFSYLFIYPNFWHFVLILFWGLIFNYSVHVRYKNYISLSVTILSIILLYVKNFMPLDPSDFLICLMIIYVLPWVFVGYSFIFDNKHEYDNYFIHFSGIIFSLVSIIAYFVISHDFQILHISIIFLLQSMLLFGSFAKLKVK